MSAEHAAPAGAEVVLIGAGGFARETAAWLCIEADRSVRLVGYLDDGTHLHGRTVGGVPVLGSIDRAPEWRGARFVVCTGSPRNFTSRQAIVGRLPLPRERYATLVHPRASITGSVAVGAGCVLGANVVATADVTVGDHVLVMPGVVMTHDDVIEDFVTIGAGALLAGGVRIGRGAYIGAGACIREGCTIGAGALIGMGSLVLHDVPAGEVWCGQPARRLRDVETHGPALSAGGGRR